MSAATNSEPSSPKRARNSAWLTAFALAFVCSAANADSGIGEAPRHADVEEYEGEYTHILDGVHAPPMQTLGPDSIRFSRAPALGGDGFVVTLRPRRDAYVAEIVWVFGHDAMGWRRTRQQTLRLSRDEYAEIAETIDHLLAEGVASDPQPSEAGEEAAILVCSDGPGYLTERNRAGDVSWRGHAACDSTNEAIHDYLTGFLFDRLGARR